MSDPDNVTAIMRSAARQATGPAPRVADPRSRGRWTPTDMTRSSTSMRASRRAEGLSEGVDHIADLDAPAVVRRQRSSPRASGKTATSISSPSATACACATASTASGPQSAPGHHQGRAHLRLKIMAGWTSAVAQATDVTPRPPPPIVSLRGPPPRRDRHAPAGKPPLHHLGSRMSGPLQQRRC